MKKEKKVKKLNTEEKTLQTVPTESEVLSKGKEDLTETLTATEKVEKMGTLLPIETGKVKFYNNKT